MTGDRGLEAVVDVVAALPVFFELRFRSTRRATSQEAMTEALPDMVFNKSASNRCIQARPSQMIISSNSRPARSVQRDRGMITRAGIEANISCLKRAFGLDRCTWRGLAHFKAYVWSAVVAYNLSLLARLCTPGVLGAGEDAPNRSRPAARSRTPLASGTLA